MAGLRVDGCVRLQGKRAGRSGVDKEFRLRGNRHIRPLVAVHLRHLHGGTLVIARKVDAHIHAAGHVVQKVMARKEGQDQCAGNFCFIIARIVRLARIVQPVLIAAIRVQREGHVASTGGMAVMPMRSGST